MTPRRLFCQHRFPQPSARDIEWLWRDTISVSSSTAQMSTEACLRILTQACSPRLLCTDAFFSASLDSVSLDGRSQEKSLHVELLGSTQALCQFPAEDKSVGNHIHRRGFVNRRLQLGESNAPAEFNVRKCKWIFLAS